MDDKEVIEKLKRDVEVLQEQMERAVKYIGNNYTYFNARINHLESKVDFNG